jgi:Zn-dependent protease
VAESRDGAHRASDLLVALAHHYATSGQAPQGGKRVIGPTLQIARIAGIPIRVDVSWLLIFLLFVYLVIRNFFAPLFPDVGLGGRIGLAVLTILLLFLSVLLHELAHSLVARAAGLEVKAIALFILGGVSQLEGEPRRPWVEFWMALSGPLVSLLLGVLCGGLALLFGAGELARAILEERVARVPAAGAVLFWLTLQNLLLFGFNMLPGFPLDGGRVVRALIWALSGSYHQATRIAVWLGLGLGALFVLAGGALLLKEGTGGVWLLLVGLYLLFRPGRACVRPPCKNAYARWNSIRRWNSRWTRHRRPTCCRLMPPRQCRRHRCCRMRRGRCPLPRRNQTPLSISHHLANNVE